MVQVDFDVIIIGGAFSGASTAILLKRKHPSLRILIVERVEEFDRKVGEATTEISGCFLTKHLMITHHLAHHQIPKQGLRLWFCRSENDAFDDCGETGAKYHARLPSYQLDRAVLDTSILKEAVALGAELWRPAKVGEITTGEGDNTLTVEVEGETRTVRSRWLIDASGRASVIARKNNWLKPLTEHPTSSVWARVRGTKDWDGYEIRTANPKYARASHASRSAATNHLTGYGWWCWIIPLKGGDYSVGIVYDERIFQLPPGPTLGDRLMAHLMQNPIGKKIFVDAECIEGDVKAYSMLPYYSEQVAGPGWFTVGDAAGFIDPLYSQGLDFCAWTVSATVGAISDEVEGKSIDPKKLNADFQRAYHSWFRALYLDKYYYLGDADLMIPAFLMDLGLYFYGPVRDAVNFPERGMRELPFCESPSQFVAQSMAFYNRRLVAIAKNRMRLGTYGRNNLNRRELIAGFIPDWTVWKVILRGMRLWMRAEVVNFFESLAGKKSSALSSIPPKVIAPVSASTDPVI
ncbi:MAG: NAD(P)/FAD-dependent oxidoreductase [Chthoniobacterales bacterium]